MLLIGFFAWLKHSISVGFHGILLWLDAIVYEFVARIYDIFLLLSKANIFDEDFYQRFAQRIYAILGVIMLFVLAYALLKALVDPEQLTKGDKGIGKMVPTFVTSLILVGLLPTIFSFAYNVQNFILEENTIGILVLGTGVSGDSISNVRNQFGVRLAYTTIHAFLNAENANCGEGEGFGDETCDSIEEKILSDPSNFVVIASMADKIADGEVIYRWGFSTGVGLFLIYVIATFCLDLAVRSVRLSFLQLMAPIPILMRVMPTKNDMFKNWLKKTIACFTEVFVRVFIMYLVVYFVSNFRLNWVEGASAFQTALINVLIIMGIFMFAKEAPKLLSEITGIDSGNIKLGLKDFMGKLSSGGALAAGGILGAGATALARNAYHAKKNFGEAKPGEKKAAFFRGIRSTLSGGISGAFRGGMAGYGAKNFADVRNAATKGAKGATDARDRREAYRASHPEGVFLGHAEDMWTGAKEWAQGGFEADEAKIKWANEVLDQNSKLKAATESLRGKQSNNAQLLNGIEVDWKGTDAQKAEYANLFSQFNGMSLSAIQDYINQQKNSKITREEFTVNGTLDQAAYDNALREQARKNGNLDTMYKQLEGAVNQRLQTAAYDATLAHEIGIEGDEKYSDIVNYIQQMNDSLKSNAREQIDVHADNVGLAVKNAADKIEFERNQMAADVERKKRDRERRQGNKK